MSETTNNPVTLAELGSLFEDKNKPVLAALNELKQPKARLAEPESAVLAESAMGRFMDFEVAGIPIGKAVIGGGIAILATELIDGFLLKYNQTSKNVAGIVKLASAGVTMKFGQKYLGKEAAGVLALLLTFDAIRDLTPIDSWMNTVANKVTGTKPTAGLASHEAELQKLRAEYQKQQIQKVEPVSTSYYAMAMGGR
jgi:hypothetical protein